MFRMSHGPQMPYLVGNVDKSILTHKEVVGGYFFRFRFKRMSILASGSYQLNETSDEIFRLRLIHFIAIYTINNDVIHYT